MLLPEPQSLIERSLYTIPPHAKTTEQNRPTLLVSWWCTGFALAIIVVRICGRYIRTERLFMEDKIMALSIIPLMARMALVHVILRFGTNNAAIPGDLDAEGIRRREIGSKLVLASRIMYAAFLWIAKLTVSEFLKRLTSRFWKRSYELVLQSIRYFLLITFIGVVISTLSECQPFKHYWQVRPDPGAACREGVAQLLMMGTSDIVTDLLLVCFPIPIVLKSQMPIKRKISLCLLFALSLILVAITLYRVIEVIDRKYDQQFRSLLASIEILAAAAVSNALVLGSFMRDRGAKKQRYRHHGGSLSAHSSQDTRPAVRRNLTARNWGSDADLAEELGISCGADLQEKESDEPRRAPLAIPLEKDAKNLTPLPRHLSVSGNTPENIVEKEGGSSSKDHATTVVPNSPSKAAFFDIGGLLSDDDIIQRSRQQSIASPNVQNFSRPISPPQAGSSRPSRPAYSRNAGSDAFLEDVGGLLGTEPHSSSRDRPQNGQRKMSLVDVLRETGPEGSNLPPKAVGKARTVTPDIQDLGGLLR